MMQSGLIQAVLLAFQRLPVNWAPVALGSIKLRAIGHIDDVSCGHLRFHVRTVCNQILLADLQYSTRHNMLATHHVSSSAARA